MPLLEVIQSLEHIAGVSARFLWQEQQVGDVLHTYADTGLAQTYLGYAPRVSLLEGLQEELLFVDSLKADLSVTE